MKKNTKIRHQITCCECGNIFASVRSDARFCSGKCKKNASLRAIAHRQAVEEANFNLALIAEQETLLAQKLSALVSVLRENAKRQEIQHNAEQILLAYDAIRLERKCVLEIERKLRKKEVERWRAQQRMLAQEKERKTQEYALLIERKLTSIRHHQFFCKLRIERKDRQLQYEREQRERERECKELVLRKELAEREQKERRKKRNDAKLARLAQENAKRKAQINCAKIVIEGLIANLFER